MGAKVAVLCERSGRVRDSFIRAGHDAVSCDTEPSDAPGPHIQGDLRDQDWSWADLVIAHPVCTYMCNSGVRWLFGRGKKRDGGVDCWAIIQKVGRGGIENPIPHCYAKLPPYSQLIQPYHFGDPESKATCLWLHGLPPLMPTHVDAPLFGVEAVTDIRTSVHDCPPGPERSRIRSVTFEGIANAMAAQWGSLLTPTRKAP